MLSVAKHLVQPTLHGILRFAQDDS